MLSVPPTPGIFNTTGYSECEQKSVFETRKSKNGKEHRVLAKAGSNIMGQPKLSKQNLNMLRQAESNVDRIMNATTTSISTIIPAPMDTPINLDINAFLEKANSSKKDLEVLNELKREHNPLIGILSKRKSNMAVVLKYWSQGDTAAAFNALTMMNDQSIVMDVFSATFAEGQRMDVLSLENVPVVISLALMLVKAKYDCYVQTGVKTIRKLFQSFGDVLSFARA
eukprot:TRINITY_DN4131_c0_g3_i1.p3 TRINITY_DN4131_c0_g3~~TRINITY_DN4131_c0_g3_i1.p3  ORF type:complete len:225 (-),score=76.71 TRINITY_DN4131_c0_g3_i1:2232-2906(-)